MKRNELQLTRIAEALGMSKEAFLDRNPDADLEDTCELLQIWEALEHSADRRKVLAFARALVDRR